MFLLRICNGSLADPLQHDGLMAAVGLTSGFPFEYFGFALATTTLDPNGTPGTAISADIRNTPVPEPATMILLGSGLLAAFRTRRRTASACTGGTTAVVPVRSGK